MKVDEFRKVKLEVLGLLMRPFIRFCIRHSHSLQDFIRIAKVTYVQLAAEEIEKTGKKINISRLSVMTGLYRRDVARIFVQGEDPTEDRLGVVERVIGQWRHDKRFVSKNGSPRMLTYKGDESEFSQLVYSVSQAIKPGTILFQLDRMGTIEKTKSGVTLLRETAGFGGFPKKGFELLAKDLETIIAAGEENLLVEQDEKGISNLHMRTEYDNVFRKDLPRIRAWLITEGKAFHKRAREFISQFDKDINPDQETEIAGQRVIIGTFSLTPKLEEMAKDAWEKVKSEK